LAHHPLGGVSYGSGARDTTRLAASDPALWTEILLLNAPAVVAALDAHQDSLRELRDLVSGQRAGELEAWLAEAARFRKGIDR
jgi:prephenate dehydrogenase